MLTCGSDREKTTAAGRKLVLVLELKYAVCGIRNMRNINCAYFKYISRRESQSGILCQYSAQSMVHRHIKSLYNLVSSIH